MPHTPWTPEEIQALRDIYASALFGPARAAEYARRLPGRSVASIHGKAKHLSIQRAVGRRAWTPEEVERLRAEWASGRTAADLADEFQRSVNALYNKIRLLGLPHRQDWARVVVTPALDQAIRAEYSGTRVGGCRRVAQRFGVQIGWVKSRARHLGLTRNMAHYRAPWTPAEDAIVEEAHANGGARYVANRLKKAGYNRSVHAVQCRVHHLGLTWKNRETYTAMDLARLMGIDSKTLSQWIQRGYLRAHKENSSGMHRSEEPTHWLIRQRDARRFLIEHVARYRLATCDRFWLVSILAWDDATPGHFSATCGYDGGGGFDELRVAA